MAITSPRVIFACTIPTIIVILSYIWFKKKKEVTPKSDSGCSRSNSSSTTLSIRQEIEEAEKKQSVEKPEPPFDILCEEPESTFDILPIEPGSTIDILPVEPVSTFETLSVEQSEPTFETLPVKQQQEFEDTSIVEETVLEASPNRVEEADHVEQPVKMVSDTVSKKREKKKKKSFTSVGTTPAPAEGLTSKNANSSEKTLAPPKSAIESEKVSELTKRIDETHIVSTTPPDESNDNTVTTPEENDSLSSKSNDTVVDGFDSTLVDTNVTIDASQENTFLQSPPKEHVTTSQRKRNNRPTSNGHVPAPSSNELANANSVVAEHPTAVSSPGSIDDSDVHKITNGTDTSAYGSASHSPAEELLESPTVSNYSDMHSEGSSDSGKGCSEIHRLSGESSTSGFPLTPMSVFEFELPQELCGRLIGQKGRYVNYIKSKSRANISIKRHPFNADLKLCAVIGTEEDINAALVVIRKRFPLSRFPCISMVQVNAPLLSNVPIPDTLQLHLPEGVTCDVILSSLVSAGHFFIQQPTHPTYPSLGRLDQCMLHCYMNGMGAPELPKPVEAGVICAASTMGGWYRAQIVHVQADADECEVRFVDYGGYSQEAISSLRQIRSDFMTLPFQASECYLANVVPFDETEGWTLDATSLFEDMAQGQILQAQVASYSENGIPYIHLYRIQGVMTTFINRELVDCGVAKWVDHQA